MGSDLRATGHEQAWSWSLAEWDQMWRPSNWLKKPPRPHPTHVFHLVAILALASYANIVANEVLDASWDVPFNLGVLAVAILVARRAGTTWTSMGLRPDRAKRGLIVGGSVIGIIVVGMAIAIAVPATRELFKDERIIENSIPWVLFQAFVRIPFATALYEEILFRGIVFGMLVRRRSPLVAGLITSLLFGLWHVLPTLQTLDTNPGGDLFTGAIGVTIAIAGTIAGTAIAGFAFLWIRLYANSTYASVLAHIGTNSVAMLASLIVIYVLP
jgi:membrane protease YdiL (CAAX protease family)